MVLRNALFATLLFLLLCSQSASAQWSLQSGEMDNQIHRGIALIYDMDFSNADKTFDSVIAEHPEHPSGYFYRAMVTFWRAITNPDNTTYDAEYRSYLKQSIDRADALLAKNEKDLAGIFYKGAALGMRARIFAIRPTWQDAVGLILGDAKEGIKYLDQIEEIIPSNPDVLFGRGLYNYYVEDVKQDHPFLRPIISLFATGNKAVGLQMLEMAAQKASYANTEAQYELVKLYYTSEHNYVRAGAYATYLTHKYPNNVIFLHYLGFSRVTAHDIDGYDSVYRVILARCREHKEAYTIRQAREAMYFIGQAQMDRANGNMDSALYYLYNSDLLSRKVSPPDKLEWYVTQSELLMGEAYDVRGQRKEAMDMYKRVLDLPEYKTAHADAQRYLTTPYKR